LPDSRPAADEAATFYRRYIDAVPDGDVRATLAAQIDATAALVDGADAGHAYAPGKWTVRQVVQHLADAERIFATRLLRIARGDATPQPGFDENAYADATAADTRPLADVADDLRAVRASTLALLGGLPADAWSRTGIVSGHPVSVRALAWIAAGHERHHAAILRERYGLTGA
jgi:uncharacterized damage-inducible protein DinB